MGTIGVVGNAYYLMAPSLTSIEFLEHLVFLFISIECVYIAFRFAAVAMSHPWRIRWQLYFGVVLMLVDFVQELVQGRYAQAMGSLLVGLFFWKMSLVGMRAIAIAREGRQEFANSQD